MNVGELKELLDDYGDHLEVVIDVDEFMGGVYPVTDVTTLGGLNDGTKVRIDYG